VALTALPRPLTTIHESQAKGTNPAQSRGGQRAFGEIVSGVFTPVLAKHSKSFSLIDCISVGVDRMQRNFEPMQEQVEAWQRSELTDVTAKVVIYEAFVEGKLEAPKHLARTVHDLYFEPKYEEFESRTIWSLSNAFTSAFKELEPIPQFKATAKLGEFLEDFPGIQVVDEPPADVLEDISNKKKWRRGTELLGLYSGVVRTKRSFNHVEYAPDLIFVFRGPILRCSKGDLPAEVKRVVWHKVAHWLGYETEEQVKALGL